mmetsp:Transcript_40613/g.101591  ORF Transcript_40613/g.101591 Transcript_40613/m.101591 type:complete len:154 (+) Transcript_40613:3-464(+)
MGRITAAEKLVLHAQRCTLSPAESLNSFRKNPSSLGLENYTIKYALFSSRPIDNVAAVSVVRFVVLMTLIPGTLFYFFVAVQSFQQGRIPAYQHYRFSNLETRQGSLSPKTPGIAEFGLMRLGEGKGVASLALEYPAKPRGRRAGSWLWMVRP